MEDQELRDIIRGLLQDELTIKEVVMKTKGYMSGTWNDSLRPVIEDLFKDIGVRQIDAKRNEFGSQIKVLLNNGDSIRGETTNSPLSGTISINGKYKKPLNGPQAMNLVVTMRKAWDEYSGKAA